MSTDRRLLAGALGVALLVAACGGSSATATPTPGAASPSTAASAAAPSTAASAAPSASSDSSSGGPDISLAPGAAADLEKLLPDKVGTLTFQKQSFDGASIPGSGTPFDKSKVDPVLSKYGKSIADVRFAVGTAISGTTFATEFAIQIKGVPATQFATDLDESSITDANKTTIGGKSVWATTDSGMTTAYYAHDDVLVGFVAATDDVTTMLQGLP